jgi:hypothetical protein
MLLVRADEMIHYHNRSSGLLLTHTSGGFPPFEFKAG